MRKASERDWATYLESAMRSAGLSQAELARRSGLAESMVSRWLRGLNQPDVPNLRRVRPVLGVAMLELLVAAGHLTLDEAQLRDEPSPPAPVHVGLATNGLTAEQVRQVEAYVAFLRAQNAAASQALSVVRHLPQSGQPSQPAQPVPAERSTPSVGPVVEPAARRAVAGEASESAEPLRYAAYGGAKLTREQQAKVREQARLAREAAERTGQPVVYLDDSDDEPAPPGG